MSEESIHDDVRDIRSMLTTFIGEQKLAQGRTEQKIDGLNDRLFGQAGCIAPIWEKASEASATASKAIAKVNTQHAYAVGYAGGAVAAFGAIKFVLGKMGLHF